MKNEEIVAAIAALDPEVKTEGLQKKELTLILAGLEAPAKTKELEGTIAEMGASLAEAEARPAAKGGAFEQSVGKHEGKEVVMTIPRARHNGNIITPGDIKKRPELLKELLDMKAGFLKFK